MDLNPEQTPLDVCVGLDQGQIQELHIIVDFSGSYSGILVKRICCF